ncbi:HET-domain-containing protein [Coniochaeta ligniaria NRRL 30616]|uniref:HET-domain-containing protein n=1 Tax=Coniochaeta ligniaria NRRL 30616 TaxID=1408157 RepID=A0A1J7IYE6_9PEZI|nr:HET-domain-containing protein [Coniochaeta ligniaria NRRL 30616]
MNRRCKFCAGLSISHLVELAEKEFVSRNFPKEAYYRHHESFSDLERSASGGCDLCQLILDCFKGAEHEYTWPREWKGSDSDLDTSMYAAAKALDVSDVKISIEADQCFSGDKIEHVRVFDTLVVQVGIDEESHRDPEGDAEYDDSLQALPALLLTLRVPRDKVTLVRGFQIGRIQVEASLGSEVYFELAKNWLERCRTNHSACNSNEPPELPTRVIDVGLAKDSTNLRILSSQGLRAEYLALSHCWGGRITPVLTTETLAVFKEALPYAELSPNFQDAITIARRLGFRYLWIDSLCIIQDSRADWEHESGRMAAVYGDATLTISAMASSASNVGILTPRPSSESVPMPTTLPLFLGNDRPEVVMVERADPEEESLDTLYHKGPLSGRGWTLQESILSRRHLYFGARQIYWKCPDSLQSADGICARFKAPDKEYKAISHVMHAKHAQQEKDDMLDKSALLREYYELVQDYSRRRLTQESDKLPAFSCLARRFQDALAAQYVAGLWSTDLERGLLWKQEVRFCRHVTSYRAPSWSWAVTDALIVFDQGGPFPPSSLKMKILEYNVVPRNDEEPFGEIQSGYLVVEGVTTVLIRSLQEGNLLALNTAVGGADFDEPARDQTINGDSSGSLYMFWTTDDYGDSYHIAAHNKPSGERLSQFKLEAFSEEQYTLFLVYADDMTEGPAECLILRQVTNQADNTFERVGRANFWDPPMGWLMSWERRTLTLV